MQDRYGMHSYKRTIGRIQNRTIHRVIVHIGTIQNQQRSACHGTGLHNIMQSTEVGVETNAHILQIKNQQIQILKLLRGRGLSLTVQRINRQGGLGVQGIGHLGTGIGLPPQSVFGHKQGLNLDPIFQHNIGQKATPDRGTLVQNQPHPLPFHMMLPLRPAVGHRRIPLLGGAIFHRINDAYHRKPHQRGRSHRRQGPPYLE